MLTNSPICSKIRQMPTAATCGEYRDFTFPPLKGSSITHVPAGYFVFEGKWKTFPLQFLFAWHSYEAKTNDELEGDNKKGSTEGRFRVTLSKGDVRMREEKRQ